MNERIEKNIIYRVLENPYSLKYVDQTERICLAAVKRDGYALRYVKYKTKEICLEAVKTFGLSLEYVEDQTEEVSLEAVKNNAYALLYVKDKTDRVCLEAINKNANAIEFIDINERSKALIVLNFYLNHKKDKDVLTKIIKKFHNDKEFIDFYTKHNIWKYVDFYKTKLNDKLIKYTMTL